MGCEAGVPLSPVHVRPKLKVVVPKYCARIARVQKGCCQTIVGGGLRDRGSVITVHARPKFKVLVPRDCARIARV